MASRLWSNLFGSWWLRRKVFTPTLLEQITTAIRSGEQDHLGEVCFAVQSRLSATSVRRGVNAREDAAKVFARLRVWDTQHNSGVLIYVLLAERRIEILADRGISARVEQGAWDAICAVMRSHYVKGGWSEGTLQGIASVQTLLREHFPAHGRVNPDELDDRPILL